VDTHLALLTLGDGGRAFQRIVRGFEANAEKQELYLGALREGGWPSQVIWGEDDPALGADQRDAIAGALGVEATVLPAKHFLQEDQAPAVATAIAELARS
jgi:pimeloyl-ACP methyl ester carboxylesterase